MFFVDTNIIVYANAAGTYRESCRQVVEAVALGNADGRTSVSVIEELFHLELSGRLGPSDGLALDAVDLFTPLLPVRESTIRSAIEMRAKGIGANDRVHAAVCAEHDIATIVSADSGFDAVRELRRVDPLDSRALGRLLRQG